MDQLTNDLEDLKNQLREEKKLTAALEAKLEIYQRALEIWQWNYSDCDCLLYADHTDDCLFAL